MIVLRHKRGGRHPEVKQDQNESVSPQTTRDKAAVDLTSVCTTCSGSELMTIEII